MLVTTDVMTEKNFFLNIFYDDDVNNRSHYAMTLTVAKVMRIHVFLIEVAAIILIVMMELQLLSWCK